MGRIITPMAAFSTKVCIPALCILFSSLLPSPSTAARASPSSTIKAVNLGGWLVAEGWIEPSLFAGIPNNDLLDGTQVQFKSVAVGKYLCAENGGGSILVANRSSASGWETFKLWRVDQTHFQFRVFGKQFVGMEAGGGTEVVAVAVAPGRSETFEIVRRASNPDRVRIRAPSGLFLQAKMETSVTADARGDGSWGDDDPSVFVMTKFGRMQGEYQVTNGYGPDRAPAVMREHWKTFIVEEDFQFMKDNGLDAVRIPVGWWIARGANPPAPYVGGSLEALDNAFSWAGKYGLKVIIDLHAAPGSQNGYEHSGGRDGSIEWGTSDESIRQTVAAIEFLAQRYAGNPSLVAVELLNEPLAEGVSFDTLKGYYQAGYDAVRRHSSSAYVVMSARLSADAGELLAFAGALQGTVLDVHYYNLFSGMFDGMTVQQNIDYVHNKRAQQLGAITRSNGQPLTFVGEWVAEWQVQGATKEEYQRFGKAQMEVFGRATFGWAYWTFRNVHNHWSLHWMITNGYISLR
uniref:Putative glucan 1,3-beta-glucosidase A n=1 Tax=Anthurium amnicola TaxID=1678845 RepID=A0A1D1XNW1_9ARAE